MDNLNRDESPDFTFYDDEGRGRVTKSTTENKFRVGELVYLLRNGQKTGRFQIADIAGPQRYILCLEGGKPFNNGQEVNETDLEKVT
ncbi:hypothetical protein F4680DRAFT_403244 [Xylaria scruposa]|nr:hypothetical protein F4680DRAFT_403244 [Xylaria scruposa]